MVLNTLVTYFNEGIFGQPYLKRDIYHHFGSDFERSRVREAIKVEGGSNKEVMEDHLIEVSLHILGCFFSTLVSLITNYFDVNRPFLWPGSVSYPSWLINARCKLVACEL